MSRGGNGGAGEETGEREGVRGEREDGGKRVGGVEGGSN